MGEVFYYLELRAQGRTREQRFLKSCKAVQCLLEDAAAKPTCNQPCKFREVTRATFLMDFSPNKLRIASTHGDHSVRVSNAVTGKCTHILRGHPRTPWCLAFSPTSDDILASGCLNGEIRIWDLMGGGSEVLQNPCAGQVITSLAFHPCGDVLAFATMNYIYYWDWSKGPPFAYTKTSLESERVRWLKFDPFGDYLYTGIGNHVGLFRDAVTGEMIVSGVVDDAGDTANLEERRNRLLRNHPRLQPQTTGLLNVQEEMLMSEEDDDSAAGNIRSSQSSHEPLSHLYRARHLTRTAVADGVGAHNSGLQNVRSDLNQSLFHVPVASGDATAWGDNRSGRRGFESTLSSQARQGEVQSRQRWGRYEPSFFNRANFSSGINSVGNSNNNSTNNSYRSGFLENVAARMNMEVPSLRQRSQQLRPSLRKNLFPAVPERPTGSSETTSFVLPRREASGSQNAETEVDMDEFQIIPIDQGQNTRGVNTRNASALSESLVNKSSSVNSSLLQRQNDCRTALQNDYQTLLSRYRSRGNAGPAATLGSNSHANHGSCLTSLLPSTSSSGDHSSANTRLSMPLLAKQEKSNSLSPDGTRTIMCPTNSVPNLASSAFRGTDNEGGFEMPSVNASIGNVRPGSSSIFGCARKIRAERAVRFSSCERESTPATAELSKHCDSLSANLESSLPGACDQSSSINQLSQDMSLTRADDLRSNSSSGASVVRSTDTSLQTNSHSSCIEAIPVSLQNLLSESANILSGQDQFSGSSSSTAVQQKPSDGKTIRFVHDSVSEQNGIVDCANGRDGSNLLPEQKEPQNGSMSSSQIGIGDLDKSKVDSLQKYKSTVKLSTARIRLYEAESRRAGRSTQNVQSGSQGLSYDGEISTNLPQNDVYVRPPAHANPQGFSFGLSRPENHHSEVPPASRSDDPDVNNPSRSTVPWQTRVASWIQRLPEFGNSEVTSYETFRTQRQRYLNSLARPGITARLESSATHGDLHPSVSQQPNQPWRSTVVTHGRHTLDPYVGLDFRNQLSVFQDRQIPRPVADQTSQTLGAMSLPASSDQGTDVVGLNEAPLDLSQADSTFRNSHFGNGRSDSVNSMPGCGRMIGAERAEPARQQGLNSCNSPNSTHRSISGSSASRALHLFTDSNPAALGSDHFYSSADTPRGNRSLPSSISFRPVKNGRNNTQSRFHPYSLQSDSLHPRALNSCRDLMNSFRGVSQTMTSGAGGTSSVPTANSAPRSLYRGNSASQTSASNEGTSRLRQLNESGQPSAFSAFSISSRGTSRNQPRSRTFTSHLNSDSLPYQSNFGGQFSTSSENSSQSLMDEQSARQNSATNAERRTVLQDSLANLSETLRTSARNLTRSISMENQTAFTEYLERRVMELDRRLTSLEHSYSSRMREMQQDHQWRRSLIDASVAARLSGAEPSLDDPRTSLHPRPATSAFLRPTTSAASANYTGIPQLPSWHMSDYVRSYNSRPERTNLQAYEDERNEGNERELTARELLMPYILRPIQLHPDDSTLMLIDVLRRRGQLERGSNTHATAIDLGADIIVGVGQSYRIQQWDITQCIVPDISDAEANVVVPHCKLHNDASCNIAHDGSLLATILPGPQGFIDEVFVALFSLKPETLGDCLYYQKFGSHAISLSISPMNRYLLVGLASKRTMHMSSSLMVGQVFKIVENKGKVASMKHHKDIYHVFEDARFSYVSVNSARWVPGVGQGLVYGTNRGDLNFIRVDRRHFYQV
ncbi:hypothetical protein BsWGS_12794 [Bradybaena similaris]